MRGRSVRAGRFATGAELVLEGTHAIPVDLRLTVQPDLQYIINPGGVSSIGNAVVLGVQLAIEF